MTQPGYPPQHPQQPQQRPGGQPQQPQQPGYPPQQPGYPPQQPGYPGQQQPPPQYPQPGQQPAPQAALAPPIPGAPPPPPPAYQVDEAAVQQAHAQAAQQASGSGGGFEWFKFLPPEGYDKWTNAPSGTSRTHNVWFCQPWAGSNTIVHHYLKHKFNYYEAGRQRFSGIDCLGAPACVFCQGLEMARQRPDLASSVEDNGKRPSNLYSYNIIDLDHPQLHVGAGGQMFPMILDVGAMMAKSVGDMTAPEGLGMVSALVDPMNGRPARLTRKKTGSDNWDVDYSAQYAPNPSPLPQEFYGVLQNLHDLSAIRKVPTHQDYVTALSRLGWPIPGGQLASPSAAHGAYQPGPQPPAQNPYPPQGYPPQGFPPQQQQPQQQLPYPEPYPAPQGYPQQPPVHQPPPQQAAPPPPQYQQQPAQPAVQQQPHTGHVPAAPPPPLGGLGHQPAPAPQAPTAPPPPPGGVGVPGGPPPPMNPPPVTTQGGQDATAYPLPTAPPSPDDVPFSQAPVVTTQQLALDPNTGKLPLGVVLDSEGRERCFGGFVDTHNLCRECPEWIKSQCVPLSGVTAKQVDPELETLQKQLEG